MSDETRALVLIERERCAMIARNARQLYEITVQLTGNAYNVACLDIEARIRGGK